MAWEVAEILHRDISVGNIMINARTRRGLLIDWDLCKYRKELSGDAAQPGGRSVSLFLMSRDVLAHSLLLGYLAIHVCAIS